MNFCLEGKLRGNIMKEGHCGDWFSGRPVSRRKQIVYCHESDLPTLVASDFLQNL